MPFLLLLLLMVACVPMGWQEPPSWIGIGGGIAFTWFGVALVVAAAMVLAQWTRRQLARDAGQRERLQRRMNSWRSYHLLSLCVLFALGLYVLGWGWVIQNRFAWGPPPDSDDLQAMWPGTEFLILAPFLVGLVLSWACFYDADRALHDAATSSPGSPPYWSRWAYLIFHIRFNLGLVLVPLLLLITVKDLPPLIPPPDDNLRAVAGASVFLIALTVYACMPWAVRLFLGLKPMPDGPLRSRLLSVSRRLNFRFSNILVWDTHGGIANAMVVGILPMLRYVVFTDRLVGEMPMEEVEAVFGHEAGHIRHRHMLYYLAFMILSLAVVMQIWDAANLKSLVNLTLRKDLVLLPLFGLVGAYIFVVFGFLSRRCERQADVYGCRAVSCARGDCQGHEGSVETSPRGRSLCPTGIRIFINALEKVACLNGISRERPGWLQSWQHSTIARRVEFLQCVLADPTIEPRFQRTVTLVKWTLFLSLGALLLILGRYLGWANLLEL
jgi:Zn-dependent protease with chaperone function